MEKDYKFQKGQQIITQPYLCGIDKYGIEGDDWEIGRIIEADGKRIMVRWFDKQLLKFVELDHYPDEYKNFYVIEAKNFIPPAKCEQALVSGSAFENAIDHTKHSYVEDSKGLPALLLGDVATVIKITTGKEVDWKEFLYQKHCH